MIKTNIKDAIESVKNEAMTNVILFTHMPNLSMEDKMYIMYFIGTMKGRPYALDFHNEPIVFTSKLDKININKEK